MKIKIYITNDKKANLCIKPGSNFIDESFYIKYDVKINGEIIFPKYSKIYGRWISEEKPCKIAQFEIISINDVNVIANSLIFSELIKLCGHEINYMNNFYLTLYENQYLTRMIINGKKIMSGDFYDTDYIKINTSEIIILLDNNEREKEYEERTLSRKSYF